MDPYLNDWLDLLLRWLHVIAAIAWIGSSFYFIALDNHLLPPKRRSDEEDGVGGEAWEIHGGGFYRIEKYRVAPRELPEPLHWFKWEAYTTWLSGFALLVVLYYVNAETYLIDRGVADLSEWQAIAISVALLALAWLVYDGLCRALDGRERVLAVVIAALVVVSAWGVSNLFSGRATYIQTGAMLGTIMVANVFFVIIPAHWKLIRAKERGEEPDPRHGLRGKQRSVHNNYLTLPVLIAMLGNHFAFAYGDDHGWLTLVALMALGAWIRHFFNLRHTGRTVWAIPATAAVGIAALAFAIRPEDSASIAARETVPVADAEAIVERRCAGCHVGAEAPNGVRLETREQIAAQAEAIRRMAVDSRAMPPGNATRMTDEERELLGAWIDQGAATSR